jgi:hypothetical protein
VYEEHNDIWIEFNKELSQLERKGVLQTLTETVNIENRVIVEQQLHPEDE